MIEIYPCLKVPEVQTIRNHIMKTLHPSWLASSSAQLESFPRVSVVMTTVVLSCSETTLVWSMISPRLSQRHFGVSNRGCIALSDPAGSTWSVVIVARVWWLLSIQVVLVGMIAVARSFKLESLMFPLPRELKKYVQFLVFHHLEPAQ